jgi:apolipoprotein N-acyltransferase
VPSTQYLGERSASLGTRHWVLGTLSAVLCILSFPDFNFSFLAWIALAPLAYAAANLKTKQAFVIGWFSGTLAYGGLLYWIIVTFRAAQQTWVLGVFCLLLLSAYLGLFWGGWAWFVSRTSRASSVLAAPAAAAAWVALEYLRTHLFSGFPWTLLGDSLWRQIPLIQIAAVTGVYGVSFLAAFLNAAFAAAAREGFLRGRWPLALAASLLAGCWVFGAVRMRAYTQEPLQAGFKVALLQGSIDQYQKWDHRYETMIQQVYTQLTDEAAREKPALIVWPETSVPGFLLQAPPLREWLIGLIRRSGTAHLVGAPSKEAPKQIYNSAYVLTSEGRINGQYDKHHLVPFGEVVPWVHVLGRWISVLNDLGGFTAGSRSAVLESPIGPIGVNICYEAIFPDLVRRSARQGAGVLINLTNDGWYMRTAAPAQHFIPNIFRAVENDRWVLRANNTGITAFINPLGQVVAASPIFVPRVVQGTVIPRSQMTLYSRYGDVFAWACLVLCIAVLLRAILRRV